jgi:predicted MPP superfamily phosphohydrolase
MKKAAICAVLFSLVFLSTAGWCAKIVYPWRATTAVVVSGSTFEVWFSADAGQTVNSITLQGPYKSVTPTFTTASSTTWTYDTWSGNTCNRKIIVTVPSDAPADKYDLILNTSTGTVKSTQSVKVIKAYKKIFYIMHITDAHRYESSGDADKNKTLREISTIIDVANVIDPEFLVETGDNIWGNDESETSWGARCDKMWNGYENGTEHIKGLCESFAAVFSTPGNHDCLTNNDYKEPNTQRPSKDWNRNHGLQNFGIVYGSARIIGANVGWAFGSGNTWQFAQQKDWLKTVGAGNMIIGMCHKPEDANFYNAFSSNGTPFKWMLTGHTHKTSENPWTVSGQRIGYTALLNKYDASRANCPVSIYKVDLAAATLTPIGNAQGANFAISTKDNYSTKKVKISFSKTNTGTNTDNVATVTNNFGYTITGARVRFVMPKGKTYQVTGGTIQQAFDGDKYHIVDASYDLAASSTKTVSIAVGTTAAMSGRHINVRPLDVSYHNNSIVVRMPTNLATGSVTVNAFSMTGRNLLSAVYAARNGEVIVPAQNLSAGVYNVRISNNNRTAGDQRLIVTR